MIKYFDLSKVLDNSDCQMAFRYGNAMIDPARVLIEYQLHLIALATLGYLVPSMHIHVTYTCSCIESVVVKKEFAR